MVNSRVDVRPIDYIVPLYIRGEQPSLSVSCSELMKMTVSANAEQIGRNHGAIMAVTDRRSFQLTLFGLIYDTLWARRKAKIDFATVIKAQKEIQNEFTIRHNDGVNNGFLVDS